MPGRAAALQAVLRSDQGCVDSLWLGINQLCLRVVKECDAPIGGGADTILVGVTDPQRRDRNGVERRPERASDLGGDRHPVRSYSDDDWVQLEDGAEALRQLPSGVAAIGEAGRIICVEGACHSTMISSLVRLGIGGLRGRGCGLLRASAPQTLRVSLDRSG